MFCSVFQGFRTPPPPPPQPTSSAPHWASNNTPGFDMSTKKIKTEKGKKTLECYAHALDSLTNKDNLGLKLLYLFKS